jgi:hypothetical protein
LKTSPKAKLHLTPEDVHEFYSKNKVHQFESWYITPVGNPSGTKMDPEQLTQTCEAILKHNPNALILLDIVVRFFNFSQSVCKNFTKAPSNKINARNSFELKNT